MTGEIKVRWHRELPSKPASAILTRRNGKWYVVFHVQVEAKEAADADTVGIDVGLTSLMALSLARRSRGRTLPSKQPRACASAPLRDASEDLLSNHLASDPLCLCGPPRQ